MLDQFFHPLGLGETGLFLLLCLTWDITGWGLLNRFKISQPDFIRPVTWWIGMGVAVFGLFLYHFAFPYSGIWFLVFSVSFALPFITQYRTSGFPSLLASWRNSRWLWLILLIFLPVLWIKTSLPPYTWDESVYHYISPYTLLNEHTWHFRSLYSNLPRTLDTAYIGLFALTRTYAPARLLHLAIFLSFQSSLFIFLRRRISLFTTITFFSGLNYLFPRLLTESTLGYIDIGTTSAILTVWLLAVESLTSPSPLSVVIFGFFAGLAVGLKYNAMPPVFLAGLAVLWAYFTKSRWLFKQILVALLGFIILGGYWYVKNVLVMGNPVFPFFFGCKTGNCGVGQEFFAWATPVTVGNIPQITKILIFDHPIIPYTVLALVTAAFYLSPSRGRKIITVLGCLVAAEALLISRFAGFTDRYFYHWQIILWLIISVGLIRVFLVVLRHLPSAIAFFGMTLIISFIAVFGALRVFSIYRQLLPGQNQFYETLYVFNRITISDWVQIQLPEIGQAVLWCERQSPPLALTVKDPELLWFSSETKFPIFLTRCHHTEDFQENQPEKYLISRQKCDLNSSISTRSHLYDTRRLAMRQANNELVCQAVPVVPGLYRLK